MTKTGGAIEPVLPAIEPALLAIETAGSACSAAVGRGGVVLAAERAAMRHGHGEALLPMVDRVMRQAAVAPAQLDAVAAAVGPGGFTGIRVGLAAAQGIALAAGARLVGVSGFAAVAARVAGSRIGAPASAAGAVLLVALDSRRAELYVQLFALERGGPLAAPAAVLPDRLRDHVGRIAGEAPLLIAGDAAEAAAMALRPRAGIAVAGGSAPDAEGVFAAALSELRLGTPAAAARPLYLRPPDVTLPKPPAPRRAAAERRQS